MLHQFLLKESQFTAVLLVQAKDKNKLQHDPTEGLQDIHIGVVPVDCSSHNQGKKRGTNILYKQKLALK
jgi:hypothetical protein